MIHNHYQFLSFFSRLNASLNCSSRATLTRVLTKIYTNSVKEFIDAARKNPVKGLNVILKGLEEKDQEWSRFQAETNRLIIEFSNWISFYIFQNLA